MCEGKGFHTRAGRPGDGPGAFAVFRDAVLNGANSVYTPEQCAAWAGPHLSAPPTWEPRLLAGTCRVATEKSGVLIGFFTMGDDGYLDFAYVAPNWMGSGVAQALLTQVEAAAADKGRNILATEASHLARRFLLRNGWRVVAAQHVIRDGVAIPNFRMEKPLTA